MPDALLPPFPPFLTNFFFPPELDRSTAEKVGPDGRLVYNAGNIVTHLYTVDFLERSCAGYQGEEQKKQKHSHSPCSHRPDEARGVQGHSQL